MSGTTAMILILALASLCQISTPGYFDPVFEEFGSHLSELGLSIDGGEHLDFDGIPDLVAYERGAIVGLSGASGAELLRIPIGGPGGYDQVLMLGDANGDGVSEILRTIVTARTITVYSGASGAVLYSVQGMAPKFGFSIALIGDLTGDGVTEFLVSDPEAQDASGIGPSGMTALYSGADGSLLRTHQIEDEYYWGLGEFRVSAAGDVNRDGTRDYLIGAPSKMPERGVCHVVSGADGSTIRIIPNPNPTEERFGTSVAFAGDCDMDGIPDQAVVTPSTNSRPRLISVFAGTDGRLLWEATGTGSYGLGSNILGGFDWDGDGRGDLVTTEQVFYAANGRQGAVHLLSGQDGGLLATRYGEPAYVGFGTQLAWFGDLDADGRPEIGVSSPQHGVHPVGTRAGRIQAFGWHPGLRANADRISANHGGVVQLRISLPSALASEQYLLLASASGIGPTLFRGVFLPLTPDSFLMRTANAPPPFLANSLGSLDVSGDAYPVLTLAPGAASSLIGTTLWFAAVVGPSHAFTCSTVAKSVTILP